MNARSMLLRSLAALALAASSLAAQAEIVRFHATLGPEAALAKGSGTFFAEYDTLSQLLHLEASWSGLSGGTSVAHIHCCLATPADDPLDPRTVGVAVTPTTLPGFPTGLTSGFYEVDLDLTLLSTYTTAFRNNFGGGTALGARDALLAGMSQGRAYFNIHSSSFPGGEIRGFIRVPEPGTLPLVALAGAGQLAATVRRRRTP